jgi:hypothetical protein
MKKEGQGMAAHSWYENHIADFPAEVLNEA